MSHVQPYIPGAPPPLSRLVRRIDEISTLPQVALQIIEVANDPNSNAVDLKRVMENDPALAARVLRCVNSSAFGVRMKITNLQQAIAYLGQKQIRNLAVTASVNELFKQEEIAGSYRRSLLWKHLVSVGVCARLIAMRRKFAAFEDVFLAGLMHDIGIILEDQHAHPFFCDVIRSLPSANSLCEAERGQLGFNHAQLGAKIAAAWGFPLAVQEAIRFHHASERCRSEEIDKVRFVEIANLICSVKGISSVGVQLVQFPRTALEALSLTRNDLAVLVEDLDQELAANANLLHM